jgi:hypothetical protein
MADIESAATTPSSRPVEGLGQDKEPEAPRDGWTLLSVAFPSVVSQFENQCFMGAEGLGVGALALGLMPQRFTW